MIYSDFRTALCIVSKTHSQLFQIAVNHDSLRIIALFKILFIGRLVLVVTLVLSQFWFFWFFFAITQKFLSRSGFQNHFFPLQTKILVCSYFCYSSWMNTHTKKNHTGKYSGKRTNEGKFELN